MPDYNNLNISVINGDTLVPKITGIRPGVAKADAIAANYGKQVMQPVHGNRENDAVYDNVVRVRNTAAVMSVFMGSYEKSSCNATFSNIERLYGNSTVTPGYNVSNIVESAEQDLIRNAINNIGINQGVSAIEDLKKVAGSSSWTKGTSPDKVGIKGIGSMPHFEKNGFAEQLSKTGMFVASGGKTTIKPGTVRTEAPSTYVFEKHKGSEIGNLLDFRYGGSIQNLADKAIKENDRQKYRDMFINNRNELRNDLRGTKKTFHNREMFLNDAKSSAKEFIRNKYNIDIRTGSTKEIREILNKVDKESYNPYNTKITSANKEYVKEIIKGYEKNFGGDKIAPIHKGLTTQQIRGLNIIGNNILGEDIMTGWRVVYTGGKLVYAAGRVGNAIARNIIHTSVHFGYNSAIVGAVIQGNTALANELKKNRFDYDEGIKDANEMRRLKRENPEEYKKLKREKTLHKKRKKRERRLDKIEQEHKKLVLKKKYAGKRIRKNGKVIRFTRKDELRLRFLRIRYSWLKNRGVVGYVLKNKPNIKVVLDRVTKTFKVVLKGISMPFKGIWTLISSPEKFVEWLLLHLLNPLVTWVKTYIIGGIAAACLNFALLLVVAQVILILLLIFLFFISELINGSIAGALDDQNYVQYCVDVTSEELGKQLFKVWQRDAKSYYSGFSNDEDGVLDNLGNKLWKRSADERIALIENEKYDCYYELGDADLGHIWAMTKDEQKEEGIAEVSPIPEGKELTGINANILPITSMMHFRYYDDLDFLHYPTAMGYMFYLYINSHHEPHDETELDGDYPHYSFEHDPEEDCEIIYNGNVEYRINTHRTNRNELEEECTNIYVHGFDKEKLKEAVKQRGRMKDWLDGTAIVKIVQWLNVEITGGKETDIKILHGDGVWVGEKPQDSKGICDNYMAKCYDGENESGGEHHDIKDDSSFYGMGGVGPATDTTTEFNSDSGCPGYEHHHTKERGCYKEKTDETGAGTGEWELVCTLEEHTHSDWNGEGDPGCFKTAYICKGHCGGHATPLVNMFIDYDFSSLEQLDGFKTPILLTESEIHGIPLNIIGLGEEVLLNSVQTIKQWQAVWNFKMMQWFMPIKFACPQAYVEAYYKARIYYTAVIVDYVKDAIVSLFTGGVPHSRDEAKGELISKSSSDKDYFYFDGWFREDGTEKYTKDLISLYGRWEDDYRDGIINWKDFEVEFPMGWVKPITEKEIKELLININPSLSDEEIERLINNPDDPNFSGSDAERRLAIAVKFLGHVTYGTAQRSAIYSNGNLWEGSTDCSGFVSAVLKRSGHDYGLITASSFYSHGTNSSMANLKPGDIIAHAHGGAGYTGHVMIYIGMQPNKNGVLVPSVIHSTTRDGKSGVMITELTSSYWNSRGCRSFTP